MKKVRKAVIPAAGLGTRFLPATKAMAKEMLPIVDKPTIQFIVEEAIASGIEDILIVTGKSKRSIEDHFDANIELEEHLSKQGKEALLDLIKQKTNINLFFVRQPYPKGLGHAVLQAKAFVGDEPFVVMLGDDLMDSEVPLTKQLIDVYNETHASNIAVMEVDPADTSKYGIIDPEREIKDGVFNVQRFVEKPKPEEAPSNLAIIGRYLLTPEIFNLLENQTPGAGGEIQLTDAIDTLNLTQRVFAKRFDGKRYDVGSKIGFLEMSIEYGLNHPEISHELRDYIIKLGDELRTENSSNPIVEVEESE
ncbi:UTP--glucose-1-phosphate uridylyltransferase GalU [Tuanshanicoccus lijuaniae]|uniref:UTP--glucose-1-phosphate uridylyltransferase GalU n=1 Tax=Aerococcaceae bacterium zg-1292 TaxID=2774330 RepID=UPI001937EE27|nr:UTP--glucose-1-phosphate uridylyltransferase GalU [Aerococcaceae bacterium zg-1292]MBS4455480.1 UTP--glucose-1-phosphate uridylyltransferase GalU [Aerococcaceae bacterium zg-A91]MBS4457099.1 UTP--glucose-1-phosphate uridylyltransferase GalU [Aerococcaceae bacterium zg-BR33]QQA37879.1 UTP--glucose-1-phosphate uridylyltransferase GalU [Aerococcaceae bacterium zg-1292]